MTVVLGLFQLVLHLVGRAFDHRGIFWLLMVLPLVVTFVLTVAYRTGMGSPGASANGVCYEGWPTFPFAEKPYYGPVNPR